METKIENERGEKVGKGSRRKGEEREREGGKKKEEK